MKQKARVIVAGALGKMGKETLKAIAGDEELELIAAVDIKAKGEKVADLIGIAGLDISLENDLDEVLENYQPDVLVDFTNPQAVFNNARSALKIGVFCVIGTTGLNEIEIKELEKLAEKSKWG